MLVNEQGRVIKMCVEECVDRTQPVNGRKSLIVTGQSMSTRLHLDLGDHYALNSKVAVR